MIIDGKAIAADILTAARTRVAGLGRVPVVRAIAVAPTAATESYLRIKSARAADAGMRLEVVRLPDAASEDDIRAAILAGGADALIVQLPLPAPIDTLHVLDAIPLALDADVLSRSARNAFLRHEIDALMPPVVAAVEEIMARARVELTGKKATVIGNGWLVGEPVAAWLRMRGALVSVLTRDSFDTPPLKEADIIVSGAGSPHLIKPSMLKQGVALIDAGTSESGGALAGDMDPACAEVASAFTPVPGGVGPVAVACLFRNVAALLTRKSV